MHTGGRGLTAQMSQLTRKQLKTGSTFCKQTSIGAERTNELSVGIKAGRGNLAGRGQQVLVCENDNKERGTESRAQYQQTL